AAGIASRAQGILNSQIGNTYGSSNNRIGILPLFKAIKKRTHDGKMLLPKSNPLQDILLSRFSLVTPYIKFNTPIKSVNYSGDVILLTDKSGNQFEAKKVIVTVPISIVKSGAISFSPGLPASMTGSLNKFGMDSSMKFIFDFKKNFWGDGSGFVWGGTTAPQYLNTGVGRSTLSRTLAITVNGPAAATLSAMTRENQIKAILAELDSVYAGQASQFLRYTLSDNGVTPAPPVYPIVAVKDWGKDEYAKGGQSYPLPGATDDDRINIGQPINKKIFFAGEATDVSGDAGTINGALASAERAANEVINSILEA
ncbi:MAG TPA: NAD(P)/FAD-dependent oxidoreductase, partial [Cyclobacteriaceae bacterium]|nr:NAD(P)/FAD-dependent oxidoreductase [Cyclobacteriaceae bacterium]